jgi:hypothetical protein
MIDDDYVMHSGKYAGCLLSDVPLGDLGYWGMRSIATATDRAAMQVFYYAERQRRRKAARTLPGGPPKGAERNSGRACLTAGANGRQAA